MSARTWDPGPAADPEGTEPRLLGPDAVDQLAGMVMTLGMELSVLGRRIAVAERRLAISGAPELGADEEARVDEQAAAEVDRLVGRLLANVLPDRTHARPLVDQQFRSGGTGR
jgi:hypothetical protein